MKSAHKGFSLIETMMYAAGICCITLTLISAMTQSMDGLQIVRKKAHLSTSLCAALSLLIKDIHESAADISAWKKMGPSEYVWASQENDVGWHLHNKTLYRVKGDFDAFLGQWRNKKRTVVIKNIDDFIIEPSYDQTVLKNFIVTMKAVDSQGHSCVKKLYVKPHLMVNV